MSQNKNESLYHSTCDLLFDKTRAEYILIVGYDAKSLTKPEILNFYKNGIPQNKEQPSQFIDDIIKYKLDRRNIIYTNHHNQLNKHPSLNTPFEHFESFISYPLVSETKGNVGSIILASTQSFSLQQPLKDTLFIVSTRLSAELEQSFFLVNRKNRQAELARKLEASGLQVERRQFTYGPAGAIAWRLGIKWPMQLLGISKFFFLVLPIYYLATFAPPSRQQAQTF